MDERIVYRSELMQATGWTKRYFKILVQKGKIPPPDIAPVDGRNGSEPGWHITSLPEDIKDKVGTGEKQQAETPELPAPEEKQVQPINEAAPSAIEAVLSPPASAPAPSPVMDGGNSPVPERFLAIGNLRADIVHKLQIDISRNGHPKSEIVSNFLTAYNSGLLMPGVFAQIGKVSRSTLYEWVKSMNEAGPQALVPQYGGSGVCKITEDEKNAVLGLCLNQNKIRPFSAIRMAKYILKNRNIESPSSPSTIMRFVTEFKKKHYDVWTLFREGEKALNDKVLPYIERDRELLQVGEGLVADGHRLNFNVINPFTGKPTRPALILFWDWRSAYPVGWEIMLEENVQCISSALRMAILTLGRMPKWVLLDNGKAFKAKVFTSDINLEESGLYGMYARLGIQAHFAMPYNAQAKPVERFFRTFTDWFERLQPSFSGSCIDDKPAYMKRNEKLMRSLHDDWVPTIPEATEMLAKWREFYAGEPSRGLKDRTPGEIFEARERGPKILPADLHYLMMAMEPRKLHRNGVSFLGMNWYDDALYGLKDEVVVRYSFSDLSRVFIFSKKNEFICAARPVAKINPMISECEDPKDLDTLKRGLAAKRRLRRETVRVTRLLGPEAEKALPWGQIVQQIPDVVRTIERIEGEQRPAMLNPSPFADEPAQALPAPLPSPSEEEDLRFNDAWERYEHLLKKPSLSGREQEFIQDYKSGLIAPGEYDAIYGARSLAGKPLSH